HAQDDIQHGHVTGVQTCALPISKTLITEMDGSMVPIVARPWLDNGNHAPVHLCDQCFGGVSGLYFVRHRSDGLAVPQSEFPDREIGRASCRERSAMRPGDGGAVR